MKRKKKAYIYKLTAKYRRHPELLLNYGFQYFADEKNEVGVFAIPLTISQDNPLFKQCVSFLEHVYMNATTEERKKDFKGLEFKKELQPDQHNVDKLVLNDELIKEFSQCQLCVSVDKNVQDQTFLFINSPLQDAHYNHETVHNCAPELIDKLIKDKVIYARRYLYN